MKGRLLRYRQGSKQIFSYLLNLVSEPFAQIIKNVCNIPSSMEVWKSFDGDVWGCCGTCNSCNSRLEGTVGSNRGDIRRGTATNVRGPSHCNSSNGYSWVLV